MKNTTEAAIFCNLKPHQVNYLVYEGVINPTEDNNRIPGKPRVFDRRDLVVLRLVAKLKADGYRNEVIKQALAELAIHWLSSSPDDAGGLLVGVEGDFHWLNPPVTITLEGKKESVYFSARPRFFYDVREIALQVFSELLDE